MLLLGSITALGPISTDSYLAAFPAMRDEFGVQGAAVQATLTAFMLGSALGPLIVGPLSDAIGRRRPFLAALSGFAALSLTAGVSRGIGELVAIRFLQGFFGLSASILGQAVLRDLTPDSDLLRAMSRVRLVSLSSPIIAPALGLLALRVTGWRGIFVGTAVLAVVLTIAIAFVPAARLRGPVSTSDSALQQSIAGYRILLSDRRVRLGNIAAACTFASLLLYITNGSLIFHDAFGITAERFGMIFTGNAVCMLVGSQLVPALAERFGAYGLFLRASLVSTFGISCMVIDATALPMSSVPYFFGLGVAVFGTGLALALPMKEVMELHPERAGAGAGLLRTGNVVTGATGGWVLGLLAATSGLPLALGMLAFNLVAMLAWVRRHHSG